MVRPKNKTEDLLLSITKICGILFKQTHRKAKETLEFKLNKSREISSFKPSIDVGIDHKWMIGLICSEFYNFF